MRDGDILIFKGDDVATLLAGRELDLIRLVSRAYVAHGRGASSLPPSVFLRFPDSQANRIIALPAYLGDGFDIAGLKWVSSFPNNLSMGLARASAVMILNSTLTGRPETIIEGSIINAKRTAASAALAAQTLLQGEKINIAGILGCGVINFEITRFLRAVCPELDQLVIFDLDAERSRRFADRCRGNFPEMKVTAARDVSGLVERCPLISLATTAITPHIDDVSACPPGAIILHISLRDLTPGVILACDNVVDDIDHVCRAQTSIHLTEQLVGDRRFIRCPLSDILRGAAEARPDPDRTVVFSPFGMGILDIAVGMFVRDLGLEQGRVTLINSFLPDTE